MNCKRMYSDNNLELPSEDEVQNMTERNSDGALTQVQNSLKKIEEEN